MNTTITPAPTPMILMLYVHPSRQADLRGEEKIVVEPDIPLTDFTDLYGNRCARARAPAGSTPPAVRSCGPAPVDFERSQC